MFAFMLSLLSVSLFCNVLCALVFRYRLVLLPLIHVCETPVDHDCSEWCNLKHADSGHHCEDWCHHSKPTPPVPAGPTDPLADWRNLALAHRGRSHSELGNARTYGNLYLNELAQQLSFDPQTARSNRMLRLGVLDDEQFAASNGTNYNDETVGDWCEAALSGQPEAVRAAWVRAYLLKVKLLRDQPFLNNNNN